MVPLRIRTLSDVECLHHERGCRCEVCKSSEACQGIDKLLLPDVATKEKKTMQKDYKERSKHFVVPRSEPLVVTDDKGMRHEYASADDFAKVADGLAVREEVMARAKKYQRDHNLPFDKALHTVLDQNEDLKCRYAAAALGAYQEMPSRSEPVLIGGRLEFDASIFDRETVSNWLQSNARQLMQLGIPLEPLRRFDSIRLLPGGKWVYPHPPAPAGADISP